MNIKTLKGKFKGNKSVSMKLKVKMVNTFGQVKLDITARLYTYQRPCSNIIVPKALYDQIFLQMRPFLGETENLKPNKNM